MLLGFCALLVLGGLTYFLDDYNTGYTAETVEMNKQVEQKTDETKKLRAKYTKVQKNADLYGEYLKQSQNGGLSVDRSVVAARLNEIAAKYYVIGKTTVSKTEELKDEKYKMPTSVVVSSEVKLPFEALTDEDIYAFIQAIDQEMPGIVRFRKFTIKRESKVTDQVINTIIKEGKYKLVSGELNFLIQGIRPVEPAAVAPVNNAKPNVPNANP